MYGRSRASSNPFVADKVSTLDFSEAQGTEMLISDQGKSENMTIS